MIFTPRLSAPEKGNPYYNSKKSGGYSSCIQGNHSGTYPNQKGISGLDMLPNCVGGAWGRFNEIGNYNYFKYFIGGNACDIFPKAKAAGWKVSNTPQPGALICWSGGSGAGHIAVVEKVISDTEIIIFQSGWSYKGAAGAWVSTHKKGDGNWLEGGDYNWMKGKYKLQGFILHPELIGEETMTQEEFNKMMDNYLDTAALKSVSNYAKEAMQEMNDKGYIVGSDKGLMPQRFMTRQEFAVVMKRILDNLPTSEINCPCINKNKD